MQGKSLEQVPAGAEEVQGPVHAVIRPVCSRLREYSCILKCRHGLLRCSLGVRPCSGGDRVLGSVKFLDALSFLTVAILLMLSFGVRTLCVTANFILQTDSTFLLSFRRCDTLGSVLIVIARYSCSARMPRWSRQGLWGGHWHVDNHQCTSSYCGAGCLVWGWGQMLTCVGSHLLMYGSLWQGGLWKDSLTLQSCQGLITLPPRQGSWSNR